LGTSEQCARCANSSFVNLSDQLVDGDGSVVDADELPVRVVDVSADVSTCEVVPLKQFVRGGKRGHYSTFGVCMLD
jgi:hypothetical protein